MNLDDKDRVSILRDLQKTATSQMSEIKRDEMSWLNRFLLFYGAMIAWLVTRFFGPIPVTGQPIPFNPNDASLLVGALVFSFLATAMFASLFIHTRHSYYGVSDRLHRIQKCLHLYKHDQWQDTIFFPVSHSSGEVRTIDDWNKLTKPWSSFSTRMLYIIGANIAADCIVYGAFDRLGKAKDVYFLCFWLGMNVALVALAYVGDYFHFRTREFPQTSPSNPASY